MKLKKFGGSAINLVYLSNQFRNLLFVKLRGISFARMLFDMLRLFCSSNVLHDEDATRLWQAHVSFRNFQN